jgi:hypothetical protein
MAAEQEILSGGFLPQQKKRPGASLHQEFQAFRFSAAARVGLFVLIG